MAVRSYIYSADERVNPTPVRFEVHVREKWRDSWVRWHNVHVLNVLWTCAPRIGVAQLRFRFGRGHLQGRLGFEPVEPQDLDNWHVRITAYTEPVNPDPNLPPNQIETGEWHGRIRADSRELQAGFDDNQYRGEQIVTAYGIESVLFDEPVLTSIAQLNPQAVGPVSRGLTFNDRGRANRQPEPVTIGFPVFAHDLSQAIFWSSRSAVDYLLKALEPVDPAGNPVYNITLPSSSRRRIPDWDRPELGTHGLSVGILLNRILARQRLYSWRVEVAADQLNVIVFTFAEQDFLVTDDKFIPGNDDQIFINAHRSPTASRAIRMEATTTYDQVVMQGARRRSCFSIADPDQNMVEGWASGLTSEYNQGASTDPAYGAKDLDDKRKANDEARSADRLRNVFSRYRLPTDWDWRAANGAGGTKNPVAPESPDDLGAVHPIYQAELAFEPTLPLLAGRDYSGSDIDNNLTANAFDTSRTKELAPMVFAPTPEDPARYVHIELAGRPSEIERTDTRTNRRWSASVSVEAREPALKINVNGQPQHVIAKADFQPLVNVDKPVGDWDWRNFIATVSIKEDRFAEVRYPENPQVAGTVRRFLVRLGDSYRLDYLLFGTVVGIKPDTGQLIRAGVGGFVNDDTETMRGLARLTFEWYGKRRNVAYWRSSQITTSIMPGALVVAMSLADQDGGTLDQPIGTVVTQVQIANPVQKGDRGDGPRISYETAFAQLDPRQI